MTIAMTNFKLKIILKVIADRLAPTMPTIISEEHMGFMKENRNVFRIKQRIKNRFSFLGSLRINTWISDSIVTSKCGI